MSKYHDTVIIVIQHELLNFPGRYFALGGLRNSYAITSVIQGSH